MAVQRVKTTGPLAVMLWSLVPVGFVVFIASHYPSAIERRAIANKARVQSAQIRPKPAATELEIILPDGRRLKADKFTVEAKAITSSTNNGESR